MTQEITSFLTNDHGRLLSLFREFQDTDPEELAKRRKRFSLFCQEMNRHGRWVSSTLVSRIKGRMSSEEEAILKQFAGKEPEEIEDSLNALQEHLENGRTDTTQLEEQLLSTLQDHFHKEEKILYPLFDEHLRDEEVSELRSQFDEERSDL